MHRRSGGLLGYQFRPLKPLPEVDILLVSYLPKPVENVSFTRRLSLGTGLTHIQAAHKGDLAINETELLMMGPEENHIIRAAIESLEGILRGLEEISGVESQVLEARLEARKDLVSTRDVVRVPEHLDVRVQRLQSMLRVLAASRVSLSRVPS